MHRLLTISVFLLMGCASLYAEGPSADMRVWKNHRIEIGRSIVSFSIPPGESRDYVKHPILQRVDLEREELFDEGFIGPNLLVRYWDYPSNQFARTDGSLDFSIRLLRSNAPLRNHEALQDAVRNSNRLFAKKMLREEGRPRANNRPVRFDPVNVAGKNGLLVTYEISASTYVVAVDERYYLEISYSTGGISEPVWRRDALAAAKSILQSIKIEPIED